MTQLTAGWAGALARPLRTRAGLIWVGVVAFFVIVYLASQASAAALTFGIASGALVAAIGLGVVLTYKGSGVVNFAAGATAMYTTYVYLTLRTKGDYLLPPLPLLPDFVNLGDPMGFWPALVVSLVTVSAIGLLMHFLVYKPLRSAPPLAKVVASVGLLVLLQAIILRRYNTTPFNLEPVLPRRGVSLPRGVTVPSDQMWAVAIVLVLAGGLWALFKFTRFGIASRANADNEKSVVLLGHAPNRLAAASWVLSSLLIGFMGIMVSTVNSFIDPITVTMLVVPALAAALIGNFTSFGITVAAGIAIAIGQGLLQDWATRSWFPQVQHGAAIPGVELLVPLLVILAVVVARGTAIPTRSTVSALRMPEAPMPGSTRSILVKSVVFFALGTGFLLVASPMWRLGLISSLIFSVFALSLVVVTGFVGQISLAQLTIAGVAGFVVGKLATGANIAFPFNMIGALVAAVLVGAIISVVSLRVRGVDLAIVTMAIAVAAERLIFGNPALTGSSFSAPVPPPHLGGLRFGPSDQTGWSLIGYDGDGKIPNPWFGVFVLAVTIGAVVLVLNFRRSRSGRLSLAVRSNERATASAGVSVTRVKVIAFITGSFFAGLGGILYGYSAGSVSVTPFASFACLTLLVYAYLGGISSAGGALATGLFAASGVGAVAMHEWFDLSQSDVLLVGAVGLVVTVVTSPEGIAGEMRRTGVRLKRVIRWPASSRGQSGPAIASTESTPGARAQALSAAPDPGLPVDAVVKEEV